MRFFAMFVTAVCVLFLIKPRLGLGPIRSPPCLKRGLFTWLSWQFLIVEVRASPEKLLSWSTTHQPTRPDKTFWDLALSDIARQTPILSQTCLNSPHTSRSVDFLSADKNSASVRRPSRVQQMTHSAAPRESTTFLPLWWRVSLSIRVQTTPNHIPSVNFVRTKNKENNINLHSLKASFKRRKPFKLLQRLVTFYTVTICP